MGCIVFSPLAQGLLTERYLNGIPKDSRATKSPFLTKAQVEEKLPCIKALHQLALERGQTLTEMALAWNLRLKEITSVLIGASRVSQIEEALRSLKNLDFSSEELSKIEDILAGNF
jgi:L-glyceraldehyde 3-phosphate reductase